MSEVKKFTEIPGIPYMVINGMKKIVEISKATVTIHEEPDSENESKMLIIADVNLTIKSYFGFPNMLRLSYEIILCFPGGSEMTWPKLHGNAFIEASDNNTIRISTAYESSNVFKNIGQIKMNFSIHNT